MSSLNRKKKHRIPALAHGGEHALAEIDLWLTGIERGLIASEYRDHFMKDIGRRIRKAQKAWPESFALKELAKRFENASAAKNA